MLLKREVMKNEGDKEEDLSEGKIKNERTQKSVRLREEAAARCTAKIKRRGAQEAGKESQS